MASTGPLRNVAGDEYAQVHQSLDQQAQALLPQFGQSEDAPVVATPAAVQDAGARIDHRGTRASSRPAVLQILKAAAAAQQLDPKLILALSYWESGWDQSRVSVTGAVGLMQVEPPTGAEAGPALLGRPVNLQDPVDNADVGAAVLRQDLNTFGSPELALAAYYQGPNSLRADGMFPDTQAYVSGILALAGRMNV